MTVPFFDLRHGVKFLMVDSVIVSIGKDNLSVPGLHLHIVSFPLCKVGEPDCLPVSNKRRLVCERDERLLEVFRYLDLAILCAVSEGSDKVPW
jgi:hypothetical protein